MLHAIIESYKKRLSDEKAAHERDVNAEKARSVQDHNSIVKEANEAINRTDARAEAAEAERQTDLNKNLLRITRERSNAKRGLQPKKSNCGYRFS